MSKSWRTIESLIGVLHVRSREMLQKYSPALKLRVFGPFTAAPFVRLSFQFCTGVASITINNHTPSSGNTKHHAQTLMEVGRMLQNGRGDYS